MSTWTEIAAAVSSEPGRILREFACASEAVHYAKRLRHQGRQVTVTPGVDQLYAVRELVTLSQIRPLVRV